MASPSSSSTTYMLSPTRNLLELTTDPKLIYPAIFNAIGNVKKSNGLPPPLLSLIVNYLEVRKEERCGSVFGESQWVEHFGRVPCAPALPLGIEEIWQGSCPIFSGKKVSQTHLFVYIPATVNGEPLTLKSLGIFAKQYFPESHDGYRYIWDGIVKQIGDQPIGHSGWVLMTNEGIPGSGGKTYTEQRNIVAALAKRTLTAYEVPSTLYGAICILAKFASSKMRLFSDTYTRCQENINGHQVIVGGFSRFGLTANYNCNNYDDDHLVVACLRNFF